MKRISIRIAHANRSASTAPEMLHPSARRDQDYHFQQKRFQLQEDTVTGRTKPQYRLGKTSSGRAYDNNFISKTDTQMAKSKRGKTSKAEKSRTTPMMQKTASQENELSKRPMLAIEDIRQDSNLWYKVRVLIFDLYNLSKYPICANRLEQTVDEHYISAPYFTEEEAVAVKSARVFESATDEIGMTIGEAISSRLEQFFEKRRASGDARPCGPHDMVPVFLDVFGMDKKELEEDNFVSRVRRAGALPTTAT